MAIPRALPPVISTSLNVGLALGGYVLTKPFLHHQFPGPAISLWFKGFYQAGFVSVTTLAALTLTTGFRAFRTKPASPLREHQVRATRVSRWAMAGLVFSLIHFTYGNRVLRIKDSLEMWPEMARAEMASWVSMHVWRTLFTDVPAWLCFVGALISEVY